MSNVKKCYICGTTRDLQIHHIYGGYNRNMSDENGFWCYLCLNDHTGRDGVHSHPEKLLKLRQVCEKKYLETHKLEEFMKLTGRNYI